MNDEMLPEIGELLFSLVIGYIGALEFLYVVRHLYHWSCGHQATLNGNDADSLQHLQDGMRSELVKADAREELAGTNVMQDGMPYKDGFRIDPQEAAIDKLKNKKILQEELLKQKKIEEETRKQLAKAEAELVRERQQADEEAVKKRKMAAEEEAENARKQLEAAKQREEEHNRKEEDERVAAENERKLIEAEKQREEKERQREIEAEATIENERKLIGAEILGTEERQREIEAERAAENERNSLEAIREREKKEAQEAADNERKLVAVEKEDEEEERKREADDQEAAENERRLLKVERESEMIEQCEQSDLEEQEDAEQSQIVFDVERERERKQKMIEENARLFLEAEQDMVQMLEAQLDAQQQRHGSANIENAPPRYIPIVEEPCIKKTFAPHSAAPADVATASNERLTQTVKTQFGQASNEIYSLTSRPLLFPGVSDDGSSVEPGSSKQSSFSTQPSEDIATTGAEEAAKHSEKQFSRIERPEPDGEDNIPTIQYTDEYLRSLDGIKQRPLVREDGSGRRRAFKKRRSSGSSTSSRESRASREEELKMFTSLEEEEFKSMHEGGESVYAPIKYTSETTLKVKSHHRRHKISPAKETKSADNSLRSSLEMLGEENINPWGEVVPEHYKDTAFWKREKAMSIDEEEIEFVGPASRAQSGDDTVTNLLKTSSFEEATHTQNEEAISALQKPVSKDDGEEDEAKYSKGDNAQSDTKTNLQTSQNTEGNSVSPRSSASPRLRRSPRVDEIDQYEEHWKETNESLKTPPTPSISVQPPTVDNAPWRDDYGLIMEGLSDFYDFTASVNPSRSRSVSRNPSPTPSAPTSPEPKNIAHNPNEGNMIETVEVYDDTGNLLEYKFSRENIIDFIESLKDEKIISHSASPPPGEKINSHKNIHVEDTNNEQFTITVENVADSPNETESSSNMTDRIEMNLLVQTLRADRGRSRSRSPLPTTDNIERSLEKRRNKLIKHNDEIFEKLRISTDSLEPNAPHKANEYSTTNEITNSPEEDYSKENMNILVESLRVVRSRSRSRSRSPLPTADNIEKSLEARRNKLIQHNDEVFEKLFEVASCAAEDHSNNREISATNTPMISIEYAENTQFSTTVDDKEEMSSLIESLRLRRSKSGSPMRMSNRPRTPEPFIVSAQHAYKLKDELGKRERRSRTPSRSQSSSPSRFSPKEMYEDSREQYIFVDRPITEPNFKLIDEPPMHILSNFSDCYDLHTMLNLEASQNRTLSKKTEEWESILAEKQRQVDEDALQKLNTAVEETELRTLTPTEGYSQIDSKETLENEETDHISDMPAKSEILRQLRCSPTTPDYDRSISAEWRDVQRIKNEMLTSGFKRSTYVGESMDLGSEFGHLRHETAHFRRSQSPTHSFNENELGMARKIAAERREAQDQILAHLIASTTDSTDDENRHGAKPKSERRKSSEEYELSLSKEVLDTQRIKEEILNSDFKRSTYVGESVDLSAQYEEMRRQAAQFQRSLSKSRSPLGFQEFSVLEKIDAEAAKRELHDKILDEMQKDTVNFQEFSKHLNADFLDNERRASDSALMQKPELLIQFADSDPDFEMDPEEYHHFRRYSLHQEQPIEEYPNDDYVYVSEIEVRTLTGTRTWTREDYYSDNFENLKVDLSDSDVVEEVSIETQNEVEAAEPPREEEDSDGSEDERRTVVEVEDEIDEDICDFNERGPADESHHEISECEEAEREMDRYADRDANDWNEVGNIDELLEYGIESEPDTEEVKQTVEEGAVGGVGSDSDSFAIDQIYDDAIKNRKQSGILRDYDSILQDMQNNFLENHSSSGGERDDDMASDVDRYAIWAKVRNLERMNSNRSSGSGTTESSVQFLEQERRDNDMRYLGDANVTARQSTRLRSRYGYVPLLQSKAVEDDNVDVNYKPKREYNWRKNFKLDDDAHNCEEDNETEEFGNYTAKELEKSAEADRQCLDMRKFSLGGESITLFSRSPEKDRKGGSITIEEETSMHAESEEIMQEIQNRNAELAADKPKKMKSKKKLRKESKVASIDKSIKDEDDSESQIYSRRSCSIQIDTTVDSPKRKSRSRRSSRSSLTNEDPTAALFSPRSSVGNIDIEEEYAEETTMLTTAASIKKKTKKRKKAKDAFIAEPEIQEEHASLTTAAEVAATISATISPDSASMNALSTLSPENSVCITPASIASESNDELPMRTSATPTPTTTIATTTTPTKSVDNFDILKDANFYPLF